jgi:hypothetical protein
MFCEKPSKNKRGRGKLLGLENFLAVWQWILMKKEQI